MPAGSPIADWPSWKFHHRPVNAAGWAASIAATTQNTPTNWRTRRRLRGSTGRAFPLDETWVERVRKGALSTGPADGHRDVRALHHAAGALGGDGERDDRYRRIDVEGHVARCSSEHAERDEFTADLPPQLICLGLRKSREAMV